MLEICKRYIAVFLLSIVVKLLDDEIDQDIGLNINEGGVYEQLSKYKLPYCLLFMAIAMVIDPVYVYALFVSAYMIGMFHFPGRVLPLKLKAYHEILLIMAISIVLIPVRIFLHSFILVMIIQLIDDLLDWKYDQQYGYKNYANQFGKGEVILFSCILLVISFMLSWVDTLIILPSALFVNYLYSRL